MSNQLAPLSASVTRILSLTGFPKELKTRDFQVAFSDWENVMGGFRIKWIDDTSLLIVFTDAGVAKRAYLQALASPPAAIFSPTSSTRVAVIKPYDGPDAQSIIQNVNSRQNTNASRGHNPRPSVSAPNGSVAHARVSSGTSRNGNLNANGTMAVNGSITELSPTPSHVTIPNGNASNMSSFGREPSPTLPYIPSHPTLDSLISSSSTFGDESILNDPAILASSADIPSSGPRIGDPGKRMLGAALGMRHPGLGLRSMSSGGGHSGGGADQALKEVQKAMGGLAVSD